MRIIPVLAALGVVALFLSGCQDPNGGGGTTNSAGGSTIVAGRNGSTTTASRGRGSQLPPRSSSPRRKQSGGLLDWGKSSKSDPWSIECAVIQGAYQKRNADDLAAALRKVSELRADRVQVRHEGDCSRVLYGDYDLRYVRPSSTKNDARKGADDRVIEMTPEIKKDLNFIRTLALGDGQYPFYAARAVPVDDDSFYWPPDHDLRNAKGAYSLHVGVTYNTDTFHDYKQAAVDWVRALREDGFEAYYFHDPIKRMCSICVGTFGEDMLIEEDVEEKVREGNQWVTVVKKKRSYSNAFTELQDKHFPFNLENGQQIKKRYSDGKQMINQSFPVPIPKPVDEDEDE